MYDVAWRCDMNYVSSKREKHSASLRLKGFPALLRLSKYLTVK